jgi:hypothetical protein
MDWIEDTTRGDPRRQRLPRTTTTTRARVASSRRQPVIRGDAEAHSGATHNRDIAVEVPVAEAVLVGDTNPVLTSVLGAPTEKALEIHTHLRTAINNLPTLAECSNFYEIDTHYKECLRLLRSSQREYMNVANEPPVQARETWSRFWANARHQEQDWARALDDCRKTALALLYRVCDLVTNPDGTLQAEAIFNVFQTRRIVEILVLCLAMDRANCLYNMSITATGERGLGWYAKGQERVYQGLRTPPLPLNTSGHTINKRLVRLQIAFFQDDPMINRWLSVEAPERFFV